MTCKPLHSFCSGEFTLVYRPLFPILLEKATTSNSCHFTNSVKTMQSSMRRNRSSYVVTSSECRSCKLLLKNIIRKNERLGHKTSKGGKKSKQGAHPQQCSQYRCQTVVKPLRALFHALRTLQLASSLIYSHFVD